MNKIFIASPFLLSTLPFLAIAEESLKLSPVTVTSTRSQHDSRLTSNTVISREDIERKQLKSVEEALRGVAGINITNNGGLGKQTSIYLRGTESDHILVLIDGIKAGSATSGAAAWQHIPVSEIESIEVVRGPKSSLYGADAIGGVIHIHTRNASSDTAKVNPVVSVGGGTYGHYKVQAGVSGKVGKAWYNLNASHEQAEGFDSCDGSLSYGCFTNEPDRDGYENHAASFRLGYQLTDWLTIEGHTLYSGGETEFDGGSQNEADYTQLVYGGQVNIQATDFWAINLNAGASQDESTNYLNGAKKGVFDTQRVSFSALNNFTLAPMHIVSLGYDFLDDSIDSTNNYAETSRNNHAVFIQYQGEFMQNQIQLAYRSDHNEQFGQNSTWNAAWGYAFENGILVSASYGTGFKAPTFNELYWPASPFYSGNSQLNPEKSESYEIGVSGEHADWNWSLNGYLTNIDNMIAYDVSISAPNNLSKAQIMGIEAVIGGQIYDFDVQLNYNALDPKSKDVATNGHVLARRAQQLVRLDVDRKIGEASIGTTVNFEGRRFDDIQNTRAIEGFVTWDLRAEYQFYEQLTLQGAVKNILNTQYQTASGYNSAGVTVFFNMRYAPQL